MSYQWGPQGPAFEFPSTYRMENRFLTLRAVALLVTACLLLWMVFNEPDPSTAGPAYLRLMQQRGSYYPHVLMSFLLFGLAGFDLFSAASQRRLTMLPGQPASLTNEVSRQARGASSGAGVVVELITTGKVPPTPLKGLYRRPLMALSADIAAAPISLQAYLSLRVAHLLFGVVLLVLLLATWVLPLQPPVKALVMLVYGGATLGLLARSAWIAKAPPAPLSMGVVLALVLLLAGGAGWGAHELPALASLGNVGLPLGVLALLLCLLMVEGLAVLAGRAQITPPPKGGITPAEASVDLVAEPERVLTEIDRELHRYWSEGIPNRRHVWHMPSAEAKAEGRFEVSVLEETQPLLPTDQRERIATLTGGQVAWLMSMNVLGLLMSLAGCALWVRLTHAHMADKTSAWSTAALGVVLLLMGAYAIRAGHRLWSRVEVLSSLLQLDCKGVRNGTVSAAEAAAGVQAMKLRMRVVKVRSWFYADAEHFIGSRVVQEVVGDELTARRAVQQVKAYAERQAAEERPQAAAPPPPHPARGSFGTTPPSPPAGRAMQPRFCSSCGTPVLAGARFCQSCGTQIS